MKTLTDRKIAEEQKVTYDTQRMAQETRQDLEKEIQRNRDQIAENRMHIAILEEKTVVSKPIKTLTGKD